MKRMAAIAVLLVCFCFVIVSADAKVKSVGNTNYIGNRAPLRVNPYTELPLGSVKPRGWLREQLVRMQNGLTGNLDAAYELVCGKRNGWLGGDGDGWERGPYWIDGLIGLAYALEDEKLIAKVKPWVEWSLNNQAEDGYFGPVPFEKEPRREEGMQKTPRRDWWPKMVMLKVLQQHYSATGDERVIELMRKYFRYQLKELGKRPLGHWTFWGNRRGGENMMMVYWLYNITGDEFLLELADMLYKQTFAWTDKFLNGRALSMEGYIHCVNLAMGIKQPIIYYQQHPDEKYIRSVHKALDDIKRYHGQPQGMYGGDEQLHGRKPTQGSEFCSAVEFMYSLEKVLAITGEVRFADHLERIAFNALPTQANDDFTAKQYFQQANQVMLTAGRRNFYVDHGHDLVYGLLSGYACCTTNMHQGWPKFTQSLWMVSADNGLAALVYSPCEVRAKVAGGVEVGIREDTFYPFDETVRFEVSPAKKVEFALHLRIPAWCKQGRITVNGKEWGKFEGGTIAKVSRKWGRGDVVELELPMEISTSRWDENSVAVDRGPLVYALKVAERWEKKETKELGTFFEVFPGSAWNYGLLKNVVDFPQQGFELVKSEERARYPWSLEGAPLKLKTKGKQIPSWKLYMNSAGPLPCTATWLFWTEATEVEDIELVPYGCTTLRITEFPVVK